MTQAELQLERPKAWQYPAGFWKWIADPANDAIYRAFERRALQMAGIRKRYSARTIVETIRWDTDLTDTDEQFKINDHYTPGMARLFMADHGRSYPNFFQLRDGIGRNV